jgi:aminoglycoside/choline kinase family phosphotransferase
MAVPAINACRKKPLMDARAQALREWASAILAIDVAGSSWRAVAGDASSRRYFRLYCGPQSWICVDAPPAIEKNPEFLRVRDILGAAGVRVPELVAVSVERGFLLLGDLGEQLLLPLLNPESVHTHYDRALDTLFAMQSIAVQDLGLPEYSAVVLREELQRFPHWFCEELLGVEISGADQRLLRCFEDRLIESAQAQPQVFVHRDFHSRNLMPQTGGELGVIDFQDALVGPICYDLVSLLRDCYIRWPGAQVRQWALAYRQRLLAGGLCPVVAEDEFMRWFDWIGLQRHLKVLGNFARLARRDGRPQYLRDLPLVLAYIHEVLDQYGEFAGLRDWFAAELTPRIALQGWSTPA